VHPLNVNDFDDDYALYETLASEAQVRAIGEIGLDYYYANDSRVRQLDVFNRFLDMAAKMKLPTLPTRSLCILIK